MKQRKVITLDEFLQKLEDKKVPVEQKDIYAERYKQSLSTARPDRRLDKLIEKLKIRTGYYSLRTRILKNPWVGNRPSTKALRWLFKTVFKDPSKYRYNRMLLGQGQLFIFEYLNPKYKNTSVLPYFDQYPLMLSLGPKTTNLGVRNLGFNLHLLPPRIRVIALVSIFEYSKKLYRYQIFLKREKPVSVDYHIIVKGLERYGVKFAVRMYIPQRMKQIVLFPYKEWHKAIFIASRGYYGIRAQKLINEWKIFNKKEGNTISPNIDWRAQI